jgi:hypothetical protein
LCFQLRFRAQTLVSIPDRAQTKTPAAIGRISASAAHFSQKKALDGRFDYDISPILLPRPLWPAQKGYTSCIAPDIAQAMLRRQQAEAVIAARQKIVHGAVSMVEMALHELSEKEVVKLDEDRRAAMVSNLLVVLCAEAEVTPVVNTGTLYT